MLGGLPGVLVGQLRVTRATAVPAATSFLLGKVPALRELDHHLMFTPVHDPGPGLG